MNSVAPSLPPWLSELYPFSPRSIETPGGAKLSYLDEGPRNDESVLMLHGNPTWSFYFRNLVRDLSPHLRCIVPDHIGMGLSEKPQKYAYTLERRIDDVAFLVGILGLKRIHLVVHDWGGAIGFGLATRKPEQIGRIVITNTAAFPSQDIPGRIALCRTPVLGEWIVRGLNGFAWPATWMAMHARSLTSAEKRGYLFPYNSWAQRVAVYRFVRDIPLEANHVSRRCIEDIAKKLPELAKKEKVIVWGGRDFCFNDRFLHRWQQVYPDTPVHRFPEAGHYVLEDSLDARGRIAEFLLNSP